MTVRHPAAELPFPDLAFPATKRDLVRAAQRSRASDCLVTALLDVEQLRFDSAADLRRALACGGRAGR